MHYLRWLCPRWVSHFLYSVSGGPKDGHKSYTVPGVSRSGHRPPPPPVLLSGQDVGHRDYESTPPDLFFTDRDREPTHWKRTVLSRVGSKGTNILLLLLWIGYPRNTSNYSIIYPYIIYIDRILNLFPLE